MEFVMGEMVVFDSVFDYMGPAYNSAKIRCSIGEGIPFVELIYGEKYINLPETASWKTFAEQSLVTLASPLVAGNVYDIEVRIYEGEVTYLTYNIIGVIDILADLPEFSSLVVTIGKA